MQVVKVSDPILVKRFKNKGNESLCRDTIQEIRHADALAVWVLLMSMPPSWVVRKKWVNKTLKIGETRYKNARRRLVELGLWKVERIRSKNGQMGGSRIIISSEIGITPKGMVPRLQVFQGGRELDTAATNITYESKQSKEQIALNPAPLVNTKNEQKEVENIFGFYFPAELEVLNNPRRVAAIFAKFEIDSELSRRVCAEFTACSRRKKVDDPWALLVKLVSLAKANKLNLSAEGEELMPLWI